jgi:hypothetical protein
MVYFDVVLVYVNSVSSRINSCCRNLQFLVFDHFQ